MPPRHSPSHLTPPYPQSRRTPQQQTPHGKPQENLQVNTSAYSQEKPLENPQEITHVDHQGKPPENPQVNRLAYSPKNPGDDLNDEINGLLNGALVIGGVIFNILVGANVLGEIPEGFLFEQWVFSKVGLPLLGFAFSLYFGLSTASRQYWRNNPIQYRVMKLAVALLQLLFFVFCRCSVILVLPQLSMQAPDTLCMLFGFSLVIGVFFKLFKVFS